MSSTFWHVHIERRKVVWDEYYTNIDQMIKKKKKKEINDTKDRSTFCQFRLRTRADLRIFAFVNEARSQPDLIQIILNAMCHIKLDVNYLLKPFCLFTR